MTRQWQVDQTNQTGTLSFFRSALLLGTAFTAIALSGTAYAQQDDAEDEKVLDTVVVDGVRGSIQSTIDIKRNNTSIVDGLSSDDIDNLPALSIAEALETITSVGSQREGSGATEISIRGLGPFLGSTVINGREATNGSGDRSVNFSQFPSELFNKIEIYKTQEARLIEGGVAGQVALSTLKPLDYGKRRFQAQAKFNVNPDNLQLEDPPRDFGYRLTGSYVDQWETDLGLFGISIGAQTNVTPNPEQEARSSSTFQSCTIASLDSSSCNGGSPNMSAEDVDPLTGDRLGLTEPFVLTTSSRSFRQNLTDDNRDAVFGAVQWQPNEKWDINFDIQYSDRTFTEYRSDLVFDANDLEPLDADAEDIIFPLTTASDGSLRTGTTTGNVEVNSQFSARIEEYIGLGGSISYDVTDRLNVSFDGSYSDTSRREEQIQARVRSERSQQVGIEVLQNGSLAHQFTIVDFDVTDPLSFDGDDANDLRVREDLNQFRNHTIWALRTDFNYDLNDTFDILGGVRFSSQAYDQLPRVRFETDGSPNPLATEFNGQPVDTSTFGPIAAAFCANGTFPEPNFLDGEIEGNLITNIDSDGNVIAAGTGNTFLTFDGLCLAEAFLGREAVVPGPEDASGAELVQSVDVLEETIAAYAQVNYDTTLGGVPVRGNFGLRYINTDVTSNSFRSDLVVTTDANGIITDINANEATVVPITGGNSYDEWLPSFNLVAEVHEDVLFRAGIFRAISRPDPSDLGAGRTFDVLNVGDNDVDEPTTIAELVDGVNANGNPELLPFTSWNFDAAVEWYANEDTLFALGLYYKRFDGGFENVGQTETFVVNGESFDRIISTTQTTDEQSEIFGVELTASHALSYLPAPFDGLGFKLSYNYADSNFEFEDGQFGAQTIIADDGTATQLSGIIPPANLPGLSEHTLSGQVYYDIGPFSASAIVKYRSDFFQQFINTPQNLRFIEDATVFEARLAYKITDNVRLTLEGINLFNEPRQQFNPTLDSFAEINVFGPRFFIGLTGKF